MIEIGSKINRSRHGCGSFLTPNLFPYLTPDRNHPTGSFRNNEKMEKQGSGRALQSSRALSEPLE